MKPLGPALCAIIAYLATPVVAADSDPVEAPTLHSGDSWVYDRTLEQGTSGFSDQKIAVVVDRVGDEIMVVGVKPDGAPTDYQDQIVGLDWSERRLLDGDQKVTERPFEFPLKIGRTWSADYVEPRRIGRQVSARIHITYKVDGWQDIVVPAGSFHVLKIEANGVLDAQIAPAAAAINGVMVTPSGATSVSQAASAPAGAAHSTTYQEIYYAPSVKYYVKRLTEQYNSENIRTSRETRSLVSFKVEP